MSFEQAIEHLKNGFLIRRKGMTLWCWLNKDNNVRCYYGMNRDKPLQYCRGWTCYDVFANDWEVQSKGEKEND